MFLPPWSSDIHNNTYLSCVRNFKIGYLVAYFKRQFDHTSSYLNTNMKL